MRHCDEPALRLAISQYPGASALRLQTSSRPYYHTVDKSSLSTFELLFLAPPPTTGATPPLGSLSPRLWHYAVDPRPRSGVSSPLPILFTSLEALESGMGSVRRFRDMLIISFRLYSERRGGRD